MASLNHPLPKDAQFFPYKSVGIWFMQHHLYGIAHNLSFSCIQATHTYWAWNPLNQFISWEQVSTLPLFLETLQLFSNWLHLFWNFLFTKFLLWQVGKSTNLLLIFTGCIYRQCIHSDWFCNLYLNLQPCLCNKWTMSWPWTISTIFCSPYLETAREKLNP